MLPLIQKLFGIIEYSSEELYGIIKGDGRIPDSARFIECIDNASERFLRAGLGALNSLDLMWRDFA